MKFNAEEFVKATGAKILREKSGECCGIENDTRRLQGGELYFAITGPHFDGHTFCADAVKKGAWGLVVEKEVPIAEDSPPIALFQVPDTVKAMGDIAAWWRRQFAIPVVAITGSNGKTTTKEMIAAILSEKWNLLKTPGNFNNLIGLPLTLNHLTKNHQAVVLEMGMNAFGEIKRLTEIAAPTVGIITNVTACHLEQLQTIDAVAAAKGELFAAMGKSGIAIVNGDDPQIQKQTKKFFGRRLTFGMSPECDVHFEHMEMRGWESMDLVFSVKGKQLKAHVQAVGIHNVMNALGACAVALSLGCSNDQMAAGLEKFSPLKMRLEQVQLANGVRLVNDAYNANPLSMEAAFRTVSSAKRKGRFLAVLGDMKELGKEASLLHQQVGKAAAKNGVGRLFLTGEFADKIAEGAITGGLVKNKITISQELDELISVIVDEVKAGDVILVKASRAMRLERIVDELKERFGI
ncbi:MAG: UDP-N-acetylmuramoyl-tripeptide--D-alanyl-D-alanine ligase [Deltaproteobacteria bacterium]|nr:UDP-N-acetylmuramoyl-tripeptide--D-alanyl-D-alanine ligase [Deltaproteobacteria bacterium]